MGLPIADHAACGQGPPEAGSRPQMAGAGRQDGLFLCYEWLDFALRVAPQTTTPDGMTREDAVLGAFLQVTFHELGHGMFDIYEIPILGREEDAADQIAGFILSQFGGE